MDFTPMVMPVLIFIRERSGIIPIDLATLERVEGADDYVSIITTTKRFLAGVRLSELEKHLGEARFVRIHRSHLINLDFVSSIERRGGGRLTVSMKSGTKIVASRAGAKRLRELTL